MTLSADPNSSQAWLSRAYSNLTLAERGRRIKNVLLEDLCFNAQQAAEKALKAVCVHFNIDFPKTHSLVRLMDILEQNNIPIPNEVRDADILTQYAVQSRYPGYDEPVTKDEYKEVVQLASKVVFWATTLLEK